MTVYSVVAFCRAKDREGGVVPEFGACGKGVLYHAIKLVDQIVDCAVTSSDVI